MTELPQTKSKHLLVKNEFKKLENFDAAYLRSKNYFNSDSTQNYLVFQGVYKYFEDTADVAIKFYATLWKSKGLSDEKISCVT